MGGHNTAATVVRDRRDEVGHEIIRRPISHHNVCSVITAHNFATAKRS